MDPAAKAAAVLGVRGPGTGFRRRRLDVPPGPLVCEDPTSSGGAAGRSGRRGVAGAAATYDDDEADTEEEPEAGGFRGSSRSRGAVARAAAAAARRSVTAERSVSPEARAAPPKRRRTAASFHPRGGGQYHTPGEGVPASLSHLPPARIKRILANRESAARSKQRKLDYMMELENQVSELTRRIKEQTQSISSMRKHCTDLGTSNRALVSQAVLLEHHNRQCDHDTEVLVEAIRKLQAMVRGAPLPAAGATLPRPVAEAAPLMSAGSGQLGRGGQLGGSGQLGGGSSPLGAALGLGLPGARGSPARGATAAPAPLGAVATPVATRAGSGEMPAVQLVADRFRALQSALADPKTAAAASALQVSGEGGPQAGSPEAILLAQYTALMQAVRAPSAAPAAAAPEPLLAGPHKPTPSVVHPLSGILAPREAAGGFAPVAAPPPLPARSDAFWTLAQALEAAGSPGPARAVPVPAPAAIAEPAQRVLSPLEDALAAALAATTSQTAGAAPPAWASQPTSAAAKAAAPHFFLGPPGSNSANGEAQLTGAALQLAQQPAPPVASLALSGKEHAQPMSPEAATAAQAAGGEHTQVQLHLSVGPPAEGSHATKKMPSGDLDLLAAAIEDPSGAAATARDDPADAAHHPTAFRIEASVPQASSSQPASSSAAATPTRPAPSRIARYESVEWQLHRAFMARHAAAAQQSSGAAAAAPAACASVPEEPAAAASPAPDARASEGAAGSEAAPKADAEPVTSAELPVALVAAGQAGGDVVDPASASSQAAAPAGPTRPRFRHSSITWQLHSAFVAQRREEAAAQASAALEPPPEEEPEDKDTGPAEKFVCDESCQLPVRDNPAESPPATCDPESILICADTPMQTGTPATEQENELTTCVLIIHQGTAVRGLSGGGLPLPTVRKRQGPPGLTPPSMFPASAVSAAQPPAQPAAVRTARSKDEPYVGVDALHMGGGGSEDRLGEQVAPAVSEEDSPRARPVLLDLNE